MVTIFQQPTGGPTTKKRLQQEQDITIFLNKMIQLSDYATDIEITMDAKQKSVINFFSSKILGKRIFKVNYEGWHRQKDGILIKDIYNDSWKRPTDAEVVFIPFGKDTDMYKVVEKFNAVWRRMCSSQEKEAVKTNIVKEVTAHAEKLEIPSIPFVLKDCKFIFEPTINITALNWGNDDGICTTLDVEYMYKNTELKRRAESVITFTYENKQEGELPIVKSSFNIYSAAEEMIQAAETSGDEITLREMAKAAQIYSEFLRDAAIVKDELDLLLIKFMSAMTAVTKKHVAACIYINEKK